MPYYNGVYVLNHIVERKNTVPDAKYFTAGIHPWHLSALPEKKDGIQLLAAHPNCIAVGECGIDKLCVNNLETQKTIFEFQCELAAGLNKPMVIHAVKAHFDCISLLKNHGIKKAVFHGFNSRYTILEKILQDGYMVSFGAAILQEKSQAAALIKLVPPSRFFLETDDSGQSIYTIYHKAGEIFSLDQKELTAQLHKNFNTFIA